MYEGSSIYSWHMSRMTPILFQEIQENTHTLSTLTTEQPVFYLLPPEPHTQQNQPCWLCSCWRGRDRDTAPSLWNPFLHHTQRHTQQTPEAGRAPCWGGAAGKVASPTSGSGYRLYRRPPVNVLQILPACALLSKCCVIHT